MLLTSLVLVTALLQGAPGRPYGEERQLLDRHLTQLSKALPNAPTPGDDLALLKQLASDAGLRNVDVGPATITETGVLGQSRRPITADATFPDVDRFFRSLQSAARLIDVENLVLRSGTFGVHVEARVRLYHRGATGPVNAGLDPARLRDRTRGATREEAARFLKDEQLVLEKTIALDDLRRRQTSPRMFLAETGASFRDAAAALTFGSLDADTGRFTLRGVVAGMGAADALENRLEGGFFRLREFSRAPKDGCFQFEIVGESFRAGPEAALALPVDEPFRPVEAFCQKDRDAMLAGVAGAMIKASGSAGLTLRAVDADLADVAAMIEAITREPFVVADDVRGRVNIDFTTVSTDDALKALPVRVDRVGNVRLLRTGARSSLSVPAAEDAPPGGRLSFRAKRARGEDVLASIAEAEPAYVSLGPTGLARVSVFARETTLADLRRATLTALQLDETREDTARVLKMHDRPTEVGPIAASSNAHVVFRARDLSVDELSLAGLGRVDDETVAFVYSPLGEIVAIRLGDTLADGVVGALDQNGMLIDTSEGPVRISLAVLRPR